MRRPLLRIWVASLLLAGASQARADGLEITFVPTQDTLNNVYPIGPNLPIPPNRFTAYQRMLPALQRAAARWAAVIHDPIKLTIEIDVITATYLPNYVDGIARPSRVEVPRAVALTALAEDAEPDDGVAQLL